MTRVQVEPRTATRLLELPRPWRFLLLCLLVMVSVVALLPAPPKELTAGWDKLNHLVAFVALSVSACAGYRSWRMRIRVLLGLLLFGAAIELAQLFVPERSAEWGDLLVDAIGIGLGALFAHASRTVWQRIAAA